MTSLNSTFKFKHVTVTAELLKFPSKKEKFDEDMKTSSLLNSFSFQQISSCNYHVL